MKALERIENDSQRFEAESKRLAGMKTAIELLDRMSLDDRLQLVQDMELGQFAETLLLDTKGESSFLRPLLIQEINRRRFGTTKPKTSTATPSSIAGVVQHVYERSSL